MRPDVGLVNVLLTLPYKGHDRIKRILTVVGQRIQSRLGEGKGEDPKQTKANKNHQNPKLKLTEKTPKQKSPKKTKHPDFLGFLTVLTFRITEA